MVSAGGGATAGRVLHLAGWWPGPTDVNGIFIREHVKAILPHLGGEVLHLEVLKSGIGLPFVERSTAVEDDITVHRIRIRTWLRRFGIADMLVRRAYQRFIGEHRGRFTLLHVHVRTEATAQVLAVAERHGIPVVVTEHNSFYHLGIRALPKAEQARERRAIRRWFAHPSIKAVMPVSQDLARVLVDDHGVRRELVTVVPNVAAAHFRPGAPPTPGPFRLLLAAVWRPPKDHDVFIRALAKLPEALRAGCCVDWVGYGPDMERIKARCARELAGMDIRFPGRLDKAALADLMRQAHVFVLPTRADNLPCVVLESLCCGTPVVSMAVNGVPELVDDSNGVLVPPGDPDALAQAIAGIMEGRHSFDREGIARQALERYSAEAVGLRIATVLNNVLHTP